MNHFFMHNLSNFPKKKLATLTSAFMLNVFFIAPFANAATDTTIVKPKTTTTTQTTKTTIKQSKTNQPTAKETITKNTSSKETGSKETQVKQTTSKSTTSKETVNDTTKPTVKATPKASIITSKITKTESNAVKPTAKKSVISKPTNLKPAETKKTETTKVTTTAQTVETPLTINSSQDEVIDGVIAIVNDTPILRSQLDRATAQAAAQLKAQGRAVPPSSQLSSQVLEQLITKQIQLDLIKRQGIQADENAVNTALTNLAKQNGVASLTEFQQKLDAQRAGSYQALRQKVSEDLALQTLEQQQLAKRVKISDQDVENFLKSPESNALEKAQYRTLHIRVPFITDDNGKVTDKQRKQALTIATQISKGLQDSNANIEQVIADAQSNYESQIQGGDMGYHTAVELPTELSKNITALEIGQVTDPISTAEGYNVIKLVDKRGGQQKIIDQWHTRHILISPSAALSPEMAKQQIDAIYEQLRQGADFATLASTYSKDPGSASNGGDLGWVNEGDMVPQFEAMMKKTSVNDFSIPFQSQFGWHILKVDEKRQKDVSEVYRKNMAREILYQRMAPQALEDWMQELRTQAYVKIMQ